MAKKSINGIWKSQSGLLIKFAETNNHSFEGYMKWSNQFFPNPSSDLMINGLIDSHSEKETKITFIVEFTDSNKGAFTCEITNQNKISVMSVKWLIFGNSVESEVISTGKAELRKEVYN